MNEHKENFLPSDETVDDDEALPAASKSTGVRKRLADDHRPISSRLELLLDRLPVSPYRLIAAVLGINLVAVTVSALLAEYVTHESPPHRVLWDGRLMVASVLDMIFIAPAIDTLLMMFLAFLVSWFSPLSITRATAGQTVIGVGLVTGLLGAAFRLADIPNIAIHFALMTYVYLRHRRISRRAGFRMAFATQSVQNCIGVVGLVTLQCCFPELVPGRPT